MAKTATRMPKQQPVKQEDGLAAPPEQQQDEQPQQPKAEHVLHERPAGPDDRGRRIRESRELLKHPVAAGQRLFEAPDGYVMVGEAEQQMAWYRDGDGGKGCWIKPLRTGQEL